MGIPKKGLRRKQLRDLTAGLAVSDGSHPIIRVEFIDDGVRKVGFFKELEPKRHYPELLAKISVATSLFHRLYMGKNCAEERLVFDEHDKLVGTLSIAIDGYTPFNYSNEAIPTDPLAREQVIPSTNTLINKNFMAAAFAYWFGDNDDAHPHNNGFAHPYSSSFDRDEAVILDFDMFFYWFTISMKEARPVIGTPKKRIALSVRDWETFPIVQDSKPYHWCTYQHPGEVTLPIVMPLQSSLINHTQALPKQYADPTQFERLAHEPKAHEQKFAIAMKALLTFQPEVAAARLTELFGDMPLNYTSLDDTNVELRIAYETEFELLCSKETNSKSFIDFIMKVYQKHYDNLYRVVVFYMGCKNNGLGVPLKATCTNLYRKPSFYRNIEKWMKAQNETTYSKDEKELKYDLAQLKNRYHQIWRDAYAPTLQDLLHSCYQLTKKALKEASSKVEVTEVEGKKVNDESLANSWELFGAMPELSIEKIEPFISVSKESQLRAAALLLINFTQKFHAIAKTYYEKERKDLTEEDNLTFITELQKLLNKRDLSIREAFAYTSSDGTEYNRISSLLERFIVEVSFQRHLTTTDEQMNDTMTATVAKEELPHTHEDVIAQYNDSLFKWAGGVRAEDLSSYINDIIDTHYKPNPVAAATLSTRYRAQPVKDYLLASHGETGGNRLAYIFSSGNEEGALNKLLIQHLTPHMLTIYPLQSVRNAVRDGIFDKDLSLYTKATVNFAKTDNRFFHLYNTEGTQLFYKTMYNWVELLSRKTFGRIIDLALTEYISGLSLLRRGVSRKDEVNGYLESSTSNAQVLALIFLNGQDSSTFNEKLFQKIIAGMKSEIRKSSVEKQQLPGNRLVMQYIHNEHKASVYGALKTYAVAQSHRQGVPLESCALSH